MVKLIKKITFFWFRRDLRNSIVKRKAKTDHDIEQLFLVLLWVGVLHRLFFVLVNVLMHCDDVSAYDFKCFLTDGGNGSVSIAYTLVRRTIVRQHNSCSDKTENDFFQKIS